MWYFEFQDHSQFCPFKNDLQGIYNEEPCTPNNYCAVIAHFYYSKKIHLAAQAVK